MKEQFNRIAKTGRTLAVFCVVWVLAWNGVQVQALGEVFDQITMNAQGGTVVASGLWGTCPWEIDSSGVLSVFPGVGENTPVKYGKGTEDHYSPWVDYLDSINSVRFVLVGGSRVIAPEISAGLMRGMSNVTTIDLSGLDTSSSSCLDSMFYQCSSLRELDVSVLDTSSATSMFEMFRGCSSLGFVNVSGWDTSKVTSLAGLFESCSSLQQIDLSGWNTTSVTSVARMFAGCSSLVSPLIADWDTANVKSTYRMFSGCDSLSSLDLSKWNTSAITGMNSMFSGCEALAKVNVKTWDTSSVTDAGSMFNDCASLTTLDVSCWNTTSMKNMSAMFWGCSSLTAINLSSWDTEDVNGSEMFSGCSSLEEITIGSRYVMSSKGMFPDPSIYPGKWRSRKDGGLYQKQEIVSRRSKVADTYTCEKVDQVEGIWGTCPWVLDAAGLLSIYPGVGTDLNGTSWENDTPWGEAAQNITSVVFAPEGGRVYASSSLSHMFVNCTNLKTVDAFRLDVSSAKSLDSMFYGCESLSTVDVSSWDTSLVTNMDEMFYGCESLSTVDVSGWDTQSVAKMSGMFYGCVNLKDLDVSDWRTSSVTSMSYMFFDCKSLTSLDVSGWNTSKVGSFGDMFNRCSSLVSLDLSNWDTSSTDTTFFSGGCWMFNGDMYYPDRDGCVSLQEISVGDKYRMPVSWMFPKATAANGKWWSLKDKQWYTVEEITTSRKGFVDTYRNTDEASIEDVDSTKVVILEAFGNELKDKNNPRVAAVEVACSWNDAWLHKASDWYNHELGSTLSVLASSAYNEDVAKDDLVDIGCDERRLFTKYPSSADYASDIDRVAYSFGVKETRAGNVCFVLVRGTPGNIEWESNFNVASSNVRSPDHEGFAKAAAELKSDLLRYIQENQLDLSTTKFVVTGHSRGAGVANIIGSMLDRGEFSDGKWSTCAENTYVYTFACPAVTMRKNITDDLYGNIFNINNPEDVIPRVPPGEWGYGRYGKNLALPSKSNMDSVQYQEYLQRMRQEFSHLTKGTSTYTPYETGALTAKAFQKAFYGLAPSVADLYEKVGINTSTADILRHLADFLGNVDDGSPLTETLKALVAKHPVFTYCLIKVFLDNAPARVLGAGATAATGATALHIYPRFKHAHTSETYISWMRVGDESLFRESWVGAMIACPVDVRVYDGSDRLVCEIVDNVVNETVMENGLAADVVNEVKYIDLPAIGEYRFEIIPTDNGVMDVAFSDETADGVVGKVVYADLPLTLGDSYAFHVASEDKAAAVAERVSANGPSGNLVAQYSSLDTPLSPIKIEVSADGTEGFVEGNAVATWGDAITVSAVPGEESEFVGWFEGSQCVSVDESYTFRAERDRDLVARFGDGGQGGEPNPTPGPTPETSPRVLSRSLTLTGTIGLNYYVDLSTVPVGELAGLDMEFTLPDGTTHAMAYTDARQGSYNGVPCRVFTCPLNVLQMADSVSARVRWSDREVGVTPYTVTQYVGAYDRAVASGAQYGRLMDEMVHAVVDYGHYAQAFLASVHGLEFDVPGSHASMPAYTPVGEDVQRQALEATAQHAMRIQKPDGWSVTESLSLDSGTDVNVYFTVPGEVAEATATVDGHGVAAERMEDGRWRVTLPQIPAHELSASHVVALTANGQSASATLSALSWVRAALRSEAYGPGTPGGAAAAAVWRYSRAADALKAGA